MHFPNQGTKVVSEEVDLISGNPKAYSWMYSVNLADGPQPQASESAFMDIDPVLSLVFLSDSGVVIRRSAKQRHAEIAPVWTTTGSEVVPRWEFN
jgi:hypothetical protein